MTRVRKKELDIMVDIAKGMSRSSGGMVYVIINRHGDIHVGMNPGGDKVFLEQGGRVAVKVFENKVEYIEEGEGNVK